MVILFSFDHFKIKFKLHVVIASTKKWMVNLMIKKVYTILYVQTYYFKEIEKKQNKREK